jgi:hypothetical protein
MVAMEHFVTVPLRTIMRPCKQPLEQARSAAQLKETPGAFCRSSVTHAATHAATASTGASTARSANIVRVVRNHRLPAIIRASAEDSQRPTQHSKDKQ